MKRKKSSICKNFNFEAILDVRYNYTQILSVRKEFSECEFFIVFQDDSWINFTVNEMITSGNRSAVFKASNDEFESITKSKIGKDILKKNPLVKEIWIADL